MRATFDRRRLHIWKALSSIDGVICPEPEGAFYAFPDLQGLLGRRIGTATPQSTLELADVVLEQAKVAFVPGEAFGAPGYARFSFALGDDDLGEGIRRIAELVASS
jgi:aspartate/methionine/tyrosine aminotransferase